MSDVDDVRDAAAVILARHGADQVLGELRAAGLGELMGEEPAVATAGIFRAHGEQLHASPVLDLVAARAAGVELRHDQAFAHPAVGGSATAPGSGTSAGGAVQGTLLAGRSGAATVLVPVATRDGRVDVLDVETAELRREPVVGIDPDLGLTAIGGGWRTGVVVAEADWALVATACRQAIAHELLAVARGILTLAVEHAATREQFGRPLGANQALKQRLADVAVAVAATHDVLDGLSPDGDAWSGRAAKALAGRTALLAAATAMQVCGGIGFSHEFPLHRSVRRVQMLDALWGSYDQVRHEIGVHLAAAAVLPVLTDLDDPRNTP